MGPPQKTLESVKREGHWRGRLLNRASPRCFQLIQKIETNTLQYAINKLHNACFFHIIEKKEKFIELKHLVDHSTEIIKM